MITFSGGWAREGVDPGIYARRLMDGAEKAAKGELENGKERKTESETEFMTINRHRVFMFVFYSPNPSLF